MSQIPSQHTSALDITRLDDFLFKAVPRLINLLPEQGLRHAEHIHRERLFCYAVCDPRLHELHTKAAFDGEGQLLLPARNFRFHINTAEHQIQGAVISVAGSRMTFTVMQLLSEPALMFLFMPDPDTGFKGWSFIVDEWGKGVQEISPEECWACMQGMMALCIEAKTGGIIKPARDAHNREYFDVESVRQRKFDPSYN